MKTNLGMILIGVISGMVFTVINSFTKDLKSWGLTLVYLIISVFLLTLWFQIVKKIIKEMGVKEINDGEKRE